MSKIVINLYDTLGSTNGIDCRVEGLSGWYLDSADGGRHEYDQDDVGEDGLMFWQFYINGVSSRISYCTGGPIDYQDDSSVTILFPSSGTTTVSVYLVDPGSLGMIYITVYDPDMNTNTISYWLHNNYDLGIYNYPTSWDGSDIWGGEFLSLRLIQEGFKIATISNVTGNVEDWDNDSVYVTFKSQDIYVNIYVTTESKIKIKINGNWVSDVRNIKVKVNGNWVDASSIAIKQDGNWQSV